MKKYEHHEIDGIGKSFERSKILDVNGYKYIMTSLIDQVPAANPKLMEEAAKKLIDILNFEGATKILTEEAQGIPIATLVSVMTNLPLAVVKKPSKKYLDAHSFSFECGYKKGKRYIAGIEKGDKVVIVDDSISTGGTLSAMITALKKIDVEVLDIGVILEKPQNLGSERIEKEHKIKVKSLVKAVIEDGKVKVQRPFHFF